MSNKKFNIRVYGIIINDLNEILVSDEFEHGIPFTKFPGGGLEFGESLPECLKREIKEELNLDVEIDDLFYFNEHAQISQFNPEHQLFSFYYFVRLRGKNDLFREQYEIPLTQEGEKQRWIKIEKLRKDIFTFPIDQSVAEHLLELVS